MVQHSVATLTCAAETGGDFGDQRVLDEEELALDPPFLRLALEIWREHPASTQPFVAALEELLSERVRYQQAAQSDQPATATPRGRSVPPPNSSLDGPP